MSISELANSKNEIEAEEQVLKEFTNINNNQAYDHVFRLRVLALNDGVTEVTSPNDYFGVDNRAGMYPTLKKALDDSILDSSKEFQLLDVGGGSGSPLDWIFSKELSKNVGKRENLINVIEPNPDLLKSYLKTLEKYPHLKKNIVYQGYVQDYYEVKENSEKPPLPSDKVDFISAIHVIYHFTDYKQNNLDPHKDIINFITFLYSILKPGGAIYIAYRDQDQDFGGNVQKKYYEEVLHEYNLFQNIAKINQARDNLIYKGQIIEYLESKDEDGFKTKPKIETLKHKFSFYAKSLADMAVLGLCGNLLESNEKEFDKGRLEFMLNEIKNAALMKVEDEKERRFGLGRTERDGKMVWKVDASHLASCMSKVFLLIGLSVAMVSLWNVWNLYSSYSSKRTQEEKEKDKNTFTPKTNSQTNKITNKTAYSSYSSRRNSIIPISKSILTFEFIKEIGKGHYGKALLVRDKIFNKKFVLKEIPLEIYENHDLLKNEHIIHSILE
uniref:Protein kinase domain-containing protein n=1 Tax=Rhizophagus irregularis (strain DAOM 181602 / DAOM 197198 / MUCL 43194) TaxID=747089 RepID=U9U219_RHIID